MILLNIKNKKFLFILIKKTISNILYLYLLNNLLYLMFLIIKIIYH